MFLLTKYCIDYKCHQFVYLANFPDGLVTCRLECDLITFSVDCLTCGLLRTKTTLGQPTDIQLYITMQKQCTTIVKRLVVAKSSRLGVAFKEHSQLSCVCGELECSVINKVIHLQFIIVRPVGFLHGLLQEKQR